MVLSNVDKSCSVIWQLASTVINLTSCSEYSLVVIQYLVNGWILLRSIASLGIDTGDVGSVYVTVINKKFIHQTTCDIIWMRNCFGRLLEIAYLSWPPITINKINSN